MECSESSPSAPLSRSDVFAGLTRSPSSQSSTMIGDRAVDILPAKANALNSVAVLWGYGSLEELRNASPDSLIESHHGLLELSSAA